MANKRFETTLSLYAQLNATDTLVLDCEVEFNDVEFCKFGHRKKTGAIGYQLLSQLKLQ